MLDRVVIYLAGGRQVRWGNCGTGNECKHSILVPWTKEDPGSSHLPLVDRTFRMLGLWNRHSLTSYGVGLRGTVCVRPLGIGAWTPFWNDRCVNWGAAAVEAGCLYHNRRIVVLMGDVYWTWERLRQLMESESFVTVATDDVDTFGLSFDHSTLPVISDALRRGGRKSGTIQRELSRVLGEDGWGRLECADWTQDFDIDWEHTQFMAGLSKNNHFRNTPEQVRLRRALGMRIPRRKR